jgi:hypothetical protein
MSDTRQQKQQKEGIPIVGEYKKSELLLCCKCKITQPKKDFYFFDCSKDGKMNICTDCFFG